ncbi:NUDIX domain-containing protein [Roseovarius sp.]|uniref:NUDIX domain-containing protein n=1 Tax=Roseovarius sp. TaxID=1486281 RepID=UPI003BAD0EE5
MVRLAVRAVIVEDGRLLLVNAYPSEESALWCAPGGGVETHSSLEDNLVREVYEETGLTISVGDPCLVNEFHSEARGFHQVEMFFRCRVGAGELTDAWVDPEAVVNRRRFFTRTELAGIALKPDSLPDVAFGGGFRYDPLEELVKP